MAEGQAVSRKEERSTGRVTSFKKSFGFIKPDDGGSDLFVHQSEIRSDGGYRTLSDGDIVEFSIALSDNKYQAVNVTAPGGVPLGSSRRPSGFGSSWGSRRSNNGTGGGHPNGGPGCYNCGMQGHLARDCSNNTGGSGGGGACFNCGDSGHFARDCPRSGNAGGEYNSGGPCYRCGGLGHMARDCANGGGSGCYNCGGFGHLARDCTSARIGGRFSGSSGLASGGRGCFHCGKEGHFARECPNAS